MSNYRDLLRRVRFADPAFAHEVTVTIKKVSSDGTESVIGTIILKDGHHGLKVTPDLRDLADSTTGTDGLGASSCCTVMGPTTSEYECGGPQYACDVITN